MNFAYNKRMLLFSHTGITLGLAITLNNFLAKQFPSPKRSRTLKEEASLPDFAHSREPSTQSWRIDYRLVLVGSMLPDLIDKPIGVFFLRDVFGNGRIFAHTLLFFFALLLLGSCLYWRYKRVGILTLSFCSGFHLILDQMWLHPHILLWPLYGLAFPEYDLTNWISHMLKALQTEPLIWCSESVGIAVLIAFGVQLLRQKAVFIFIKRGVVK